MAHNVKQGLQGADARPLDRLGERIAARRVGDLIPGASPMSEEGPDLILTPSKAEILAGERGDQVDGCRLGASPVRVIVICGIAHRHRLPWMSRRQRDQVDQLADRHTIEGFGLGEPAHVVTKINGFA